MPRAAPPPASSCSPPPTAPGARVSATRGRREQTHRLRAASASAGGGDARQHVQQCSAHAHVAHTRTPAQEGVNRAALLWRCSIFDVRVENMCVLKVRARLPRSILLKRRPLSSHKVRHTALPLRRDRTTATPSAAPRSAPASAAPASTLLHLSKQPPTRPRRLRPSVPRLRASASATWPAGSYMQSCVLALLTRARSAGPACAPCRLAITQVRLASKELRSGLGRVCRLHALSALRSLSEMAAAGGREA